MAPAYVLHYFNFTSLGEPIRFLLAYGKADWEDVRYERFGEDWQKAKNTTPCGTMPVLAMHGKQFAQSAALARYLAKQFGLAGENDLEKLQIDMVVDTCSDLFAKIGAWHYDPLPESKASGKGPLLNEQIPFCLTKLEEMAKANGGYLVNGKLTLADVFFAAPLNWYIAVTQTDLLRDFPTLRALVKTVESQPDIANYIAKRPKNSENK